VKKWYASKTLWANLILAVLAIIQLALDQMWIGAEYQALVVIAVNTVLRFISNSGVEVPAFPKKAE
jgi:hypothetical protein